MRGEKGKDKRRAAQQQTDRGRPPAILEMSGSRAAIALFVIALGVYANSISGEFVFDDTVIIQSNPAIQGLDTSRLKEIFGGHYWKTVESQGGLYRPVVMLSYALNYVLTGEDPRGYHFVNILLHAANGILVFFLLEELFSRRVLSCLSALLFILHPVRTEGVASIVGRAESLSALFILLAWWSYVRNRKSGRTVWLWFSAASFLLATLSKESAFSFIALLPLTDFILNKTKVRDPSPMPFTVVRYSLYAAVLLLSLGFRFKVLGGLTPLYINASSNPLVHTDAWTRFLTATYVFARYVWLLFFPLHLSADYSFNQIPLVTGMLSWRGMIPLGLLAVIVGGMILSARRAPFLFFCSFVFLSSFLLTSNWLRPIGTIMAERLLYFPSLGFTCAAAFVLCEGFKRPQWRTASIAACIVLVSGYTLRTIDRNLDWRDHYHLFESAVRVSPNSSLARANYAAVLLNVKNDPQGAIEHGRIATQILPGDPAAHYTLGEAYLRTGDREKAVEALSAVVRLAPRTSGGLSALRSLAAIHESLGQHSAAIADYERILEWRPGDANSQLALARLYGKAAR